MLYWCFKENVEKNNALGESITFSCVLFIRKMSQYFHSFFCREYFVSGLFYTAANAFHHKQENKLAVRLLIPL